LEKALSLVEEGSIEGAQAILEEARFILWNKAPLKIANCLFVEEEPYSFGVYKERPSNFFAPDETIYVYAEPQNYTIKEESGNYHIYFLLDFNLYDKDGNLLGGQESFGNMRYITKKPVYETFLDLKFNFDLGPGDYVLEVIVRDQLGNKSGSFRLPFKK